MLQLLALEYRLVITLPEGWRREEKYGYYFCPDHQDYLVVYSDSDSIVTLKSPTHDEPKGAP
jgi:hypothetical protein